MAKRKKGRKTPKRSSTHALLSRGFDFGCLPYAMAIANLEFPGHLSGASVDGVAYGGVWSEVVKQTIPTISLVAQKGTELGKQTDQETEGTIRQWLPNAAAGSSYFV